MCRGGGSVGFADRWVRERVGTRDRQCQSALRASLLTAAISSRAGQCTGLAALMLLLGNNGLENAVANGDTRTFTLHHIHTDEDITITYKRDGRYDDEALKKLDRFVRDWRKDEDIHMDPRLFDLIWEVSREVGWRQGHPCGLRLSFADHQRHAATPQQRRGAIQPAHTRQGDGFLHPGRVAGGVAIRRPAAAARRRRLLPVFGIAIRAP